MEIAKITAAIMTPLIGRDFALNAHDGVSLVLCEVEDRASGPDAGQAFTLVFEGPVETRLTQGQWELRCGDDEFSIFLVPIGPRSSGAHGYEAVFN